MVIWDSAILITSFFSPPKPGVTLSFIRLCPFIKATNTVDIRGFTFTVNVQSNLWNTGYSIYLHIYIYSMPLVPVPMLCANSNLPWHGLWTLTQNSVSPVYKAATIRKIQIRDFTM